ncbi:MAG: ATP-dependent zinc metalloprotease FtsH [Polyangiaceae bacterium]|nr:ATP-dependent zinc metalloprotease FtsH [Polyangiaceae bacterium]
MAGAAGTGRVEVQGDRIVVRPVQGEAVAGIVADETLRRELVQRFAAAGVPVEFDAEGPGGGRAIAAAAPLALLGAAGLAAVTLERRRRRRHVVVAGRNPSGQAVRFGDVAGMDEVKEELAETVEFLKSPERFGRLGGRAPRGVLMTGAPGTGKTLLARAVATEAGVPFLSASGSSFQEVFVGVGASRVRTLFDEARRVAPCIVFIDEIDAVGRARGRQADSAAADHDQTLNQLLVEMDGFDHTTGIVVIASTNRADVLDPALLRPGRFDRQIVVPLPDLRGRAEILAVHARPIALGDGVDLGRVARATPGFSGADLANLLNEAAILAAREGAERVEPSHIERARDRVMMGLERRGVRLDEEERRATAVHEAGHVAVGLLAGRCDPVVKVSILPRGRALGVTQALPERDRMMYRREDLEDQICMLMGGRAAEMAVLGTMTAGAADDIQRAASLARKMVSELGMSELGPVSLGEGDPRPSPALVDRAGETARALVDAQLARAVRIVESRREEIEALVDALLERDTLDADEIAECFPADVRSRRAPSLQ